MKTIAANILLLSLLPLLPLSACDDSNSPEKPTPIDRQTYTDATGLELYYNGNRMPGKTVVFSQDGNNATVTAFSDFDLSQISGSGLSGKLPSPGIIPGSPKTVLDVTVGNLRDYWEFSGEGDAPYCSYSYQGFASPEKLVLKISDAKLKSGGVCPEAWVPAPIEKNADGSFKSLPVYADWEYLPIPGVDINFSPLLEALATAPLIPVYDNTAYMSASEAIREALRAVAFLPDGNIVFSYVSSVGGADHLAQNIPNGYQYVISSPGTIKLFVNPLSFFGFILTTTSGSTPADEIELTTSGLFPSGKTGQGGKPGNASGMTAIRDILSSPMVRKILQSVIPQFVPMIAEGIPLAYTLSTTEGETAAPEGKNLRIYIDTGMAVKTLAAVLTPLLHDSSTVEALKVYISSNPALAPLLPDIEKALQLLPQAIERTTKFNLGISLVPWS